MERILIEPNETIVLKLRRHWIVLLRDTFGTILLGALPFLVLPLIVAPGALPFSITVYDEILTFAIAEWLLIVWMSLSILWTNYYLDLWIVTNRRIISIDHIALFKRRVTSWNMEHIQEVSTSIENPLQALLGYGSIEIETSGPHDEHERISGIPTPERIREIILEQTSKARKLEESNKHQESLLHTISHEMKGYLSKSGAALASIAEGDFGTVPEPVKKIANVARATTQHGVDTVVSILDSANFKTGALHIDKKRFDMRRSIIEIAEEIRPEAEQKGLLFDVSIGDGEYEYVGDETKLRRSVFRNLIDNAVRYTKTGGIRISLSASNGSIHFSVQDSGVGISESDMTRLFQEGVKGANAGSVNPDSTGYGLFVAKQIVDAHGGKIWAASDGEGKGSTFFVDLSLS